MRAPILIVALLAAAVAAADWPQWRGPNRDGALSADVEPKGWPENLKLKWKAPVGEGHASPIFAAGSIFVFARQSGDEVLLKLDPQQGKILWRQSYPAPYKMNSAATGHGEGPKSTPVYDQGHVYTFGISGILSSWDAVTGKVRWRKEFAKEFKRTSPAFGTAMSPAVDGTLLIAHVGGEDDGALTAFDKDSGAVRWQWKGDGPAYASPLVAELAGVRQVVTQSQKNIVGVSISDGKLLWKIPFTTPYGQNAVTPILFQDMLILSGLSNDTMAIRIVHRQNAWNTEIVWRNKDASMYMNSPVLSGNLLFGFTSRNKGQLFCLDARTGTTLWTGDPRQGENAALLIGPHSLIMLKNNAEMTVAAPTAQGLEVIRRYTVADSPTWAHPVLIPGGLLIKDASTLAEWTWQ